MEREAVNIDGFYTEYRIEVYERGEPWKAVSAAIYNNLPQAIDNLNLLRRKADLKRQRVDWTPLQGSFIDPF
jgi:hypothetical protein